MIFTFFIVYFRVEMLEQSVKFSRPIIFYFISSFLLYPPILRNREPKTSAFQGVFVLEQFFSSSSCFGCKRKCATNANHCGFCSKLVQSGDPNFVPLRWCIWLALSEFLCLLTNQNVTLVTLFCTKLPFFTSCYLKTAFLLANHNQEIFSCILLHKKLYGSFADHV